MCDWQRAARHGWLRIWALHKVSPNIILRGKVLDKALSWPKSWPAGTFPRNSGLQPTGVEGLTVPKGSLSITPVFRAAWCMYNPSQYGGHGECCVGARQSPPCWRLSRIGSGLYWLGLRAWRSDPRPCARLTHKLRNRAVRDNCTLSTIQRCGMEVRLQVDRGRRRHRRYPTGGVSELFLLMQGALLSLNGRSEVLRFEQMMVSLPYDIRSPNHIYPSSIERGSSYRT